MEINNIQKEVFQALSNPSSAALNQTTDNSIFSQQALQNNVTYSDWENKIDEANEFLSLHLPDSNGLYSEEDLKLREELFVIKDENGTILSQLVDSDRDGKVDKIEYYNQDENGKTVSHSYDNGADGTTDSAIEFSLNDEGNTVISEYELDKSGKKTKVNEKIYEGNAEKEEKTNDNILKDNLINIDNNEETEKDDKKDSKRKTDKK